MCPFKNNNTVDLPLIEQAAVFTNKYIINIYKLMHIKDLSYNK